MKNNRIPITIVTGSLGSGKTTLLVQLLRQPEMAHAAVIVNEFGKIGLDHHLLRQTEEETILLGGGCVCCNRREDLERECKELLYKSEKGQIRFDRIVIETTGLADPAPITFTILTDPVLQNHFYIDCIVTTVDAVNAELHFQQPEAVKQVVAADRIVITKADLVTDQQVQKVKERIRQLHPAATIHVAEKGQISSELLISPSDRSIDRLSVSVEKGEFAKQHSRLSNEIQSVSFAFHQPLDWSAFGIWLSMLLHARGEEVLRVKGMLDVGEKGPVVINGVQHIIHPPEHLDQWPNHEKFSHFILIMRSIQPAVVEQSLRSFQGLLGSTAEIIDLEVRI